jgi:predicted ABC-type ATPase
VSDELGEAIRAALARTAPVLVFLAGPNGAGKSTFFKAYLQALALPFINADEIAKRLREAEPPNPAEGLDRLAFQAAEDLRNSFLEGRLSFCTETVFSDPGGAKLDFLRRAHDFGYYSFLTFIGLSAPDLSIARVVQRVEQGGHDVPDDKLRGRFPRTLANLAKAIPLVDEAFLFDNTSEDEPYRLVATFSNGQAVRRAELLPAWAVGLPGL